MKIRFLPKAAEREKAQQQQQRRGSYLAGTAHITAPPQSSLCMVGVVMLFKLEGASADGRAALGLASCVSEPPACDSWLFKADEE